MNLYEEIELQEMQRAVDSLATENQMLQELKTPTKEKIDVVAKELFDKDFLPKPVHMNKWKTAPYYVKYRYKFYAQLAIETWEKIRNIDARVEKMCKNNIRTKDWLDFYDAINRQK